MLSYVVLAFSASSFSVIAEFTSRLLLAVAVFYLFKILFALGVFDAFNKFS